MQVHKLGLVAVALEQLAKARSSTSGRASETVYGGNESRLRQTVISLAAGRSLADHDNPGEATVHVLSGHVRLTSSTTTSEGRAGDLIPVPQERHSLEAIEDSSVLLTVVKTA